MFFAAYVDAHREYMFDTRKYTLYFYGLFKQFTGLSPLIVFNLWCPQNQTFSHKDVWTCHLKNLGWYTTRAVFASLRKTKTKQYTHTCTHGARTHAHIHTQPAEQHIQKQNKTHTHNLLNNILKTKQKNYIPRPLPTSLVRNICVTLPTDSHEHHKQITSSASASSTSFPVQNRSSQANQPWFHPNEKPQPSFISLVSIRDLRKKGGKKEEKKRRKKKKKKSCPDAICRLCEFRPSDTQMSIHLLATISMSASDVNHYYYSDSGLSGSVDSFDT